VQELPNLHWTGQVPLEVFRQENCITVRFADFTVKAKITLDATELGDLLALAEVPYRWGWNCSPSGEPSAPTTRVGSKATPPTRSLALSERYPSKHPLGL